MKLLLADLESWKEPTSMLHFRYLKREAKGLKSFGGLTPPHAIGRARTRVALESADSVEVAYVACLFAETAWQEIPDKKLVMEDELAVRDVEWDETGRLDVAVMPTAFDFTSRNTQFLGQMLTIAGSVDRDCLEKDLWHGVPSRTCRRTMGWDLTANAPGALYSSRTRAGYRAASEWLAFRALPFFPVHGRPGRLWTTACTGRRKLGDFVWPVWTPAIPAGVVSSLLVRPDLARMTSDARRALGIGGVFSAPMTKGKDGYSGVFAPSRPI